MENLSSPTTASPQLPSFFSILALAVAFYYTLSAFFSPPSPPPQRSGEDFVEPRPLLPSVQLGGITEEELKIYDGTYPKKPLLSSLHGDQGPDL
ncbi:Membrane steroid-binding protein 2 [Acorus calamus]|uniref:Membrane steroid-binding protein 2 n=1 Tax=Acorus calamus TaxID=4465 RepID=A0AAV9D8H9_ACOCL|nr:Membrane steroid-binding protein 2 [Acorus calamus]